MPADFKAVAHTLPRVERGADLQETAQTKKADPTRGLCVADMEKAANWRHWI